jgi:hypothetical protein
LDSAAETSTGAVSLSAVLSFRTVPEVFTISRLTPWSIRYYNDTANTVKQAGLDRQAANGGLGEHYSDAGTGVSTWLITGDQKNVAEMCGLAAAALAAGAVDSAAAAAWLDDGIAPNGERGRAFHRQGAHGLDMNRTYDAIDEDTMTSWLRRRNGRTIRSTDVGRPRTSTSRHHHPVGRNQLQVLVPAVRRLA